MGMSGSLTAGWASGGGSTAEATGNEDSAAYAGGSVAFSMSTETANGIAVSGSATLSRDTDGISTVGGNAAGAGGMKAITFAMDGMTVVVGDIDNAGSGAGDGGDVTTLAMANASRFYTNNNADAGDAANDGIGDGMGVSVSTALTDTTNISLSYAPTVAEQGSTLSTNVKTLGKQNGFGIGIDTTVAGMSVSLGYATNTQNTSNIENDTGFGAEVTYAASDSLSVTAGGYSGQLSDVDKDGMFVTAAYTMDADTTLSLGFASGDATTEANATTSSTVTTVNISRSLGGGMSVFAEYGNNSEDAAGTSTDGNSVAVGTSIAF
jgi:hypothetical protein